MTFDDGNLPALARLAKRSLPARTSSCPLADGAGASAAFRARIAHRTPSLRSSRLDTRHGGDEIARTANKSRVRTAISTRTIRGRQWRKRGCYPRPGKQTKNSRVSRIAFGWRMRERTERGDDGKRDRRARKRRDVAREREKRRRRAGGKGAGVWG